tara:strand:- start:5643 stop:5888 length:246 start_codon:yes stop_codon:yes gene_type:complete
MRSVILVSPSENGSQFVGSSAKKAFEYITHLYGPIKEETGKRAVSYQTFYRGIGDFPKTYSLVNWNDSRPMRITVKRLPLV